MSGFKIFAVVEFEEKSCKTVEVVSIKWLENGDSICRWPIVSGPSFKSFVKQHRLPTEDWTRFPCRVLKFCGK
jgi:hypothetical protein